MGRFSSSDDDEPVKTNKPDTVKKPYTKYVDSSSSEESKFKKGNKGIAESSSSSDSDSDSVVKNQRIAKTHNKKNKFDSSSDSSPAYRNQTIRATKKKNPVKKKFSSSSLSSP